jgi:hypothetical protein
MREVLEALDVRKQDALLGEREDLVHRFNGSDDETMVVPSDYLEVITIKR